jgi:hypothetical protein
MANLRGNPGRPTIKESKRFLVLTVELRVTQMVANPDRGTALIVNVELQLSALGMPFDLDAAVAARDKSRGRHIIRTIAKGSFDVENGARERRGRNGN